MKVKYLQKLINNLNGISMLRESERLGKRLYFIDNKNKFWFIIYDKDYGYSILEDKDFGEYKAHLSYKEVKTYIENIFKEN